MNIISRLKLRLKKQSLFDMLTAGVFIVLLLFLGIYLMRSKKTILLEMKVFKADPLYTNETLPYWVAYNIREGDVDRDALGREETKIVSVKRYELNSNKVELFLTVSLKAVYNKRMNRYEYKGKPVLVGSPLIISPGTTYIQGLVTSIQGDNLKKYKMRVEAVVPGPNYPEMTVYGVSPWVIDAIKTGDTSKDSFGNVLARVLDKKELPGLRFTNSAYGDIFAKNDPYLKRASLIIELETTKFGDAYYFLADQKVKVDSGLNIYFPQYALQPVVTNLTHVEEIK